MGYRILCSIKFDEPLGVVMWSGSGFLHSTSRLQEPDCMKAMQFIQNIYSYWENSMTSRLFRAAIVTLTFGITASSCATAPDKIEASYVSPLAYERYNCDQLSQEAERLSYRAADATGAQRKKAKNDAVATGVALVLFWPALFFIKGKGDASESEIARLKGKMEAIEKVSIQKSCNIQFRQES